MSRNGMFGGGKLPGRGRVFSQAVPGVGEEQEREEDESVSQAAEARPGEGLQEEQYKGALTGPSRVKGHLTIMGTRDGHAHLKI